jgi:hypothetical protein
MRTVATKLSPDAIKGEATRLGIVWSEATGLLIHSFEDGSAALVVQPGDHADATRLVDHLVAQGLAGPT